MGERFEEGSVVRDAREARLGGEAVRRPFKLLAAYRLACISQTSFPSSHGNFFYLTVFRAPILERRKKHLV